MALNHDCVDESKSQSQKRGGGGGGRGCSLPEFHERVLGFGT